MEEPVVDSTTRNDIMGLLSGKKAPVKEQAAGMSGETPKTFGSLLEESLARREKFDKDEADQADEVRKKVIESSRLDLIGKMRF